MKFWQSLKEWWSSESSHDSPDPFVPTLSSARAEFLSSLMKTNYTMEKLQDQTREEFRRRIQYYLGLVDSRMENFDDQLKQRDLSIRFHWGHNHDFGDFSLSGRMGDRHINILATFMDRFGEPPADLSGMRVLDVGCWTGGTSLLLAAMGAQVLAVEEVRKYAESTDYLRFAFGIEGLEVQHKSLFELDDESYYDRFDMVFCFGVIYHVTDPVLFLRILFNVLKDGGLCFLESMVTPASGMICEYQGPMRTWGGSSLSLNRGGWNWFVLSQECLVQMMSDVGFSVLGSSRHRSRALIFGRRGKYSDFLRAGLSKRKIR